MPILITGGCGFLGTNLAHRLICAGRPVHLLDNLARPGSERNLQWLREQHRAHADLLTAEIADIRDWRTMERALRNATEVYHFASQESHSFGRKEPLVDFDVNARATVHLLNALREMGRRVPFVFASTSKVYGSPNGLKFQAETGRYRPNHRNITGISEQYPLNPQGPYSCSKAVADSYVLDFARTYDLPAVVLRIGSVYGPCQFGSEEQAWVALLLLRILRCQPLTVYGDGKQVRDILQVEDMIDALISAQASMDRIKGQAYNIGGGQENSLSLIEFFELAGRIGGRVPHVRFAPWRLGDSPYYVTDFTKFQQATHWAPRIGFRQGIEQLYRWLIETGQAPPIVLPKFRRATL